MFCEELTNNGWTKSEDFDDCWTRNWGNSELMVTLFFDEDPDSGCLLFEVNESTGEYFSCTAGTIENGFPAVNAPEDGSGIILELVSQLYGKLNSLTSAGNPLPIDKATAAALIDTFNIFDFDGGE